MIALGRISLLLALVFCLASVLLLALGVRRNSKNLLRFGYFVVYAFGLATATAGVVLLAAFLKMDYGFAYVAENSDTTLSALYRAAGFWAGQQGSFLLWLLLIAIVAAVIALRDLNAAERLTGGAVMMLCGLGAVFAAIMVLDPGSNPFLEAEAGAQPSGLNPLLLHPAMILHPPALFAGYAGLAVPFAYGISTLLLGRTDKAWIDHSQKWAVAGWLFLSLGIGLGAWWAYVVLSFGGYWAWDPVENSSLVPWLTATALLHTFLICKSRGLFKRWALSLAAATFCLIVLATWTTRTGLIQSVHAFGQRSVLVWVLSAFLAALTIGSAGLIAWRWRRFASEDQTWSLASREFMHYLTDLLLTLSAAAIVGGTVIAPLFFDRTIGAGTYDAVARPLGVVVLALMAVCPLFAWRKTESIALRKALVLPILTAVASVPLWLSRGFQSNLWGFAGLVVCGFAAGAVAQFVLRAAARASGRGKISLGGLGRAFTGSRSRAAAYFVHIGMTLLLAGLIGSSVYRVEQTALLQMKLGETAGIGGYDLTYKGVAEKPGRQDSLSTAVTLEVTRDGAVLGTLEPRTDVYPSYGAAASAVILGQPMEDLFVVADEPFASTSAQIALRMVVFPLMRWVWIGAVLLCVGAVVSLWPQRRRCRDDAPLEPA